MSKTNLNLSSVLRVIKQRVARIFLCDGAFHKVSEVLVVSRELCVSQYKTGHNEMSFVDSNEDITT